MLFATFVVRSIGWQNASLAPQPALHSHTVAIEARWLFTPCQIRHYPSVLYLQIKHLKHDTSVVTFANTIAALRLLLSVLPTTTTASVVVVLQPGKRDTNCITLLALFFHLSASNLCMLNYTFTMQTTPSVFIQGETLIFVENSLPPFTKR